MINKKILKIFVACYMGSSFSYAKAMEVYKSDNRALYLGGEALVSNNIGSYNGNKNTKKIEVEGLDSKIRFTGVSNEVDGLKITGNVEIGIVGDARNTTDFNTVYNRETYIRLENNDLGSLTLGKTKSIYNILTVASTVDYINAGKIDAGLTYFSNDEGNDYGVNYMKKAIVYEKKYGNITFGFNYQHKEKDLLNETGEVDQDHYRSFLAGGAIKYEGDIIIISTGYQYVEIANSSTHGNYQEYPESALPAHLINSGIGFKLGDFYAGFAGGYYKNYISFGENHIGASAYIEYKLKKVKPYIGYEFIYGLNTYSLIRDTGNDFHNAMSRDKASKYSFDRSNIAIGILYELTTSFKVYMEYNQDIRTIRQSETSYLQPSRPSTTTIAMVYYFN
jgi:predicted porin